MKQNVIPRAALRKAFLAKLAQSGNGKVLVSIVNGTTGDRIRDAVYSRFPAKRRLQGLVLAPAGTRASIYFYSVQ